MRLLALFLTLLAAVPGMYGSGNTWSSLGPEGGEITTVAVDPQNPAVVYAGTYSGRVYKSTNGGQSWALSDKGIPEAYPSAMLPVYSLLVHPKNSSIVYAGTAFGVFRSMNSGVNWTPVVYYTVIRSLAFDPVNPSTLYAAGSSSGVLKTTNDGIAWKASKTGLGSGAFTSLAVNPQDPSIVYVSAQGSYIPEGGSTGGGVYKSSDGGVTWTSTGLLGDSTVVGLDPVNPSNVYAVRTSTSGTYFSGMAKSTDGGKTWTDLPAGNPGPLSPRAFAFDSKTGALYAAGYNGIFRSADGGNTWTGTGPNAYVESLALSPQNAAIIYGGTVKGVFRSTDGGATWIRSNTGIVANMIYALAVSPQPSSGVFAATQSEILRSVNGGAAWTDVSPYANMSIRYLEIDPKNPSTIYAGSGTIYKSTDAGAHWTPRSPNAPALSIALDPQNPSTIYAGSYNTGDYKPIYRSSDGGLNWMGMGNGFPTTYIRTLAVNPRNPSMLIAGTLNNGIYKSIDGGANWTAANNGIPSTIPVYSLLFNPQNPSTVYVGTVSGGVYKSTDGGTSWISSGNGLGNNQVLSLAIDPHGPDTLYAGTYAGGVFRTVDGGLNWTPLKSEVPIYYAQALAIDSDSHKLYAASANGVWVRPAIGSSMELTLNSGGAAALSTGGRDVLQAGYAAVDVTKGAAPYGTAVFTLKQNNTIVSEAGIPASPPTTAARIFIEYRTGVQAIPGRPGSGSVDVTTGIAIVNRGSQTANVTYTLRDLNGSSLATGHGTLGPGSHFAGFIDQLRNTVAPDFSLPSNFQSVVKFGSLEIAADQPLSVLALRGTFNQRDEFLMTTTPVADLSTAPANGSTFFPQFVDGGGYTTSLILMNPTGSYTSGTLQIRDKDGNRLSVNQVGGTADSSFRYSIPPNGVFRLQTDGFPASANSGWVRLNPDPGTSTPVGSGVFGYNPADTLVSESGVPAVVGTTHARIYVDLSENHNTGLAIANTAIAPSNITLRAYRNDGVTPVGTGQGTIQLAGRGYDAEFADQFIPGLPQGFTGVLDISSSTPFAALTLRSLVNARNEFLMTTFPVADANQPAPEPIVFPHIADGGGYTTQFILLTPTGDAGTNLRLFDERGLPMAIGD